MSDIVVRQVAPNVTTFSRPFTRFLGLFPMGGRSTAIKLSDGSVWVIASTPLSAETMEAISLMGPVKYILAASADHHRFLAEWHRAYPNASIIGVEGLPEKTNAEGLSFSGLYGVDSPDTRYGFEDEIQACYFNGFAKRDVAWLHIASKTLIVADLIFNLPANEQYTMSHSKAKPAFFMPKLAPGNKAMQKFVWSQGKDKEAMRRDARIVAGWDFERIIMCHGDIIETDAKKAWESVYARYLL
ncbi:hypothetical protein K474DRAFT_696643 [Panus rudis PR-1116 ss-1]|nr:hypothetical protein K474DRAFT_696643 [Panus rudis PR-1116 ss-1]